MRGLSAFLGKEFTEQLRTYRFIIVLVIFLLLGLMAPVFIKVLPNLVSSTPGMTIQFPTPSVDLVLGQYLQGLAQTGLIVAILVSMGSLARERERGTAAMTLSKPVSRAAFVLSKFLLLFLSFAVGIVLGAVACYAYTVVLFGSIPTATFVNVTLLGGLFIAYCIAVTLLFSAVFKNQLAAAGVSLLVLLGGSIVQGVPFLESYTPSGLTAWAGKMVTGSATSQWSAVLVSSGLIILCVVLAWRIFESKEL